MDRLRIIFAGSGEFGAPSLGAIVESGHEVVQVITQPDRPAGRGRTLTPTPIAALAASRKLPLLKTADIDREQLPEADLMVVIAFGQKIAPHIVDHPRLGSINLHASLLPKYRGAAPINWAIIRGETETGNSVIRLAQKMDAGPILRQSRVEIGKTETAGELHDRLAADGAALLLGVIEALDAGAGTHTPQDDSQATLAPKLSRASSKIDWTRPAGEIANLIRGLYPWPGCLVELQSGETKNQSTVTLVRAVPAPPPYDPFQHRVQPGDTWPGGVAAGDGTFLRVLELRPEGKRPMSLAEFENGHQWSYLRAVSRVPAM